MILSGTSCARLDACEMVLKSKQINTSDARTSSRWGKKTLVKRDMPLVQPGKARFTFSEAAVNF
jgi:hypothetical protein